ncbi:MAG TPA: fenitrothion hydrolase [Actinomycetota bacterium]|nr:fenitrothion hydrolase [Actinomycetota bacterium]
MTARLRTAVVLGGGLLLVIGSAAPAAAHGIGGRVDLPVPVWLFVWGAGAVVIVSFVALGVLWKEARLEDPAGSRPLPGPFQTLFRSRLVEAAVRTVSLGVFLGVVVAAAAGEDSAAANVAPVLVYVWFWVGMAFLHAVFGNLWATLSPWDTMARALGIGERSRREYPLAWGRWPAVFPLFGFVWLELVYPAGASPRTLAVAIAGYTVVTLGGMSLFGRETWNRRGEAFALYFDLLSRISPLARDRNGRVILRPILGGLPELFPMPGLVAFVMVLIGSTSFDGLSSSNLWLSWVGGLSPGAEVIVATTGLLGAIGAVTLAYSISMAAAGAILRTPWHPLAVRFAHSLVPIALAYATAHYFSLLVLEGQLGIRLVSDPLGLGWNLVGTANFIPNLALVSATTIWYVQVAAIVAGHVAGVVTAHDRSVALFPGQLAVRSQYALLAVMVMFTVGGLILLSGA